MGGVEMARFSGMEVASGDYITFIDSDDWLIDNNIIDKMVKAASENDSDIVEMGITRYYVPWYKKPTYRPYDGTISQPELFNNYYASFFGKNIINVNMCGKLYRKNLLNKAELTPLGLKMGEDEAFNLRVFPYIKKFTSIPEIGYAYRWGGVTTRYNPNFYTDLVKLYKYRRKFLLKHPHTEVLDYLKIELKNVLLTQIEMMITYLNLCRNDIIKWIEVELSSELYTDVPFLADRNHRHIMETSDMIAIRDRDVNCLYEIAMNRYKRNNNRRMIKRMLSFIHKIHLI